MRVMEVFVVGLGFFFRSSYYAAKPANYRKDTVGFQRFCFDLFSLFGDNILSIQSDEFDLIMRKLFQTVTFTHKGSLRILRQDQIESPWKEEVLEKETQHAAGFQTSIRLDLPGSEPEEGSNISFEKLERLRMYRKERTRRLIQEKRINEEVLRPYTSGRPRESVD